MLPLRHAQLPLAVRLVPVQCPRRRPSPPRAAAAGEVAGGVAVVIAGRPHDLVREAHRLAPGRGGGGGPAGGRGHRLAELQGGEVEARAGGGERRGQAAGARRGEQRGRRGGRAEQVLRRREPRVGGAEAVQGRRRGLAPQRLCPPQAAEEEVASRRRPGGRWPGHLGPRRPAVLPEEGLEVAGGVDLRGGPRRRRVGQSLDGGSPFPACDDRTRHAPRRPPGGRPGRPG